MGPMEIRPKTLHKVRPTGKFPVSRWASTFVSARQWFLAHFSNDGPLKFYKTFAEHGRVNNKTVFIRIF